MPLLPDLRGPGPDLPLCGPYRPTRSSVPPSSGPPAPMGSQAVGPPLPRQNISDNFFERLHVQELKDPPPLKKTGNIQCKYWLQKAVITNAIKARHLVGPMPNKNHSIQQTIMCHEVGPYQQQLLEKRWVPLGNGGPMKGPAVMRIARVRRPF